MFGSDQYLVQFCFVPLVAQNYTLNVYYIVKAEEFETWGKREKKVSEFKQSLMCVLCMKYPDFFLIQNLKMFNLKIQTETQNGK